MVSKGEVHDTSLVKRAVFTDHQPVQGVALLVGGFVYHLLKSVVVEEGPKMWNISAVWLIVVKVEISRNEEVARSFDVLF